MDSSESDLLSPPRTPAPEVPVDGTDEAGEDLGDGDHASPHGPPDQAPVAPPAPVPAVHPMPDIVLQVGENTVMYQIPGPACHDINIQWTFHPTGDHEADIAEEHRVGSMAGRIIAENPAPRPQIVNGRVVEVSVRERLVHRLDVVMTAEALGFEWPDRIEVVFKAPLPGPPPQGWTFLDQLESHLVNNNGTHNLAKERLRDAIKEEINDPDMQRGLIASMETQPDANAQNDVPPPTPELPDFSGDLPDLDDVGPNVADVPSNDAGTGGTEEPESADESEERPPDDATHVLPGVTNTDGAGGLFNTDIDEEANSPTVPPPEESAPDFGGNIPNDFGGGIPLRCNMTPAPPSSPPPSPSTPSPAAPAPPNDASDFLGLRPASTVTIIDANGIQEVERVSFPEPPDESEEVREERKKALKRFIKKRMVGATEMASDSPLFTADDEDNSVPGASDHAAPKDERGLTRRCSCQSKGAITSEAENRARHNALH